MGTVTTTIVMVTVGLIGALAGAAAAQARAAGREADLREQLAALRGGSRTDEHTLAVFRSASSRTMQEQSEQLLRLAETRYQSLERSAEARWHAQGESLLQRLGEYEAHLCRLEEQRHRESAVLSDAVGQLRRSNEEIRDEARALASALKDNTVRGTWGEVQLRRVLEQSGMEAHADFVEQQGVNGEGGSSRPDVVVRLPNGRCVVIDAKAPLDSYLRAADCQDPEERRSHCRQHARAVASHVTALSRRRYADVVEGSVDFVVMFLPGDAFLAAAHEARPELLEEAARQDVILASPSTLMAFLRGVACGWREQRVAEEAAEIAQLGRELHERIAIFAEHFSAVGTSLGRAVGAYNQALGSMERRLLVTARKFDEHGAGSTRRLPEPEGVEDLPGAPCAPELVGPDPELDHELRGRDAEVRVLRG
jgi:DNA recombination protein RmuC